MNWSRATGRASTSADATITINKKPTDEQVKLIIETINEGFEDAYGGDVYVEVDETSLPDLYEDDMGFCIGIESWLKATIEGSGYYTPAYIDGPPERCSPADSDADFKNYKFNNIEFENYIKRVFDKYEPFKDLEIVNVESWGGDLEVSEWDLDEDY